MMIMLASVINPKSVLRFKLTPYYISILHNAPRGLTVLLWPKKKTATNLLRPIFLTTFYMVS